MELVDPQEFNQESNDLGEIEIDWKNPPILKDLKENLEDASNDHRLQCEKVNVWLDNLNIKNKAKPKVSKGRSAVQPKLIRKQAEWRYAALSEPFLSNDDMFDAQPATYEDIHAANQNKLLLNHQFTNKHNKVHFVDNFVRTVTDEGTVILRTGWNFKEEKYTSVEPVIELNEDPDIAELLNEIHVLQQSDPNTFEKTVPVELKRALEESVKDGVPYAPTITGEEEVTRTRILENHPTVEICDLEDVVLDPTCKGDLDKAKFVFFRRLTSLSELEEEGGHKNLSKIRLEDNSILAAPDSSINKQENSTFTFNDNPRKQFYLWEGWVFQDIDNSGTLTSIFVSWVGNVFTKLTENPYPDKSLPFVIVPYLPVRRSLYGEPDGSLLEDNQKILGAVYRGMIDTMGRSANGQIGMRQQFLDATNRRKYERGEDYEFTGHGDPNNNIFEHKYPEIPRSAEFMINTQNQDAESMSGVKAFATGLSGEAFGDVAAGVRGVLDSASMRELGILRRLAEGIVKVGKKWTSMNGEFLSEEEVIRVTNEEFQPVRKDELAGEFDLKLSVSTAEEDDAKAKELAFILQTMGGNMDTQTANMIYAKVFKLRKMPDLANQIMNQQPDPMQQEMARLEIEKLKAEISQMQGKAVESQAEAGLDNAKTITEQAKASQIQSLSDKQALDFVEQESGVTQERDLEKQKAQAEGNKELELLKHSLEGDKELKKQEADLNASLLSSYLNKSSSKSSNSTTQ